MAEAERTKANREKGRVLKTSKERLEQLPLPEPAADVIALQNTFGNQAVVKLLQSSQNVSRPGDIYEQDAERKADEIMNTQSDALVSLPSVPAVSPPPAHRQNGSLTGHGQLLPAATRAFFERRLGQNLRAIRVHADPAANEVAQSFNAEAFTSGCDIYFQEGRYAPGTPTGMKLLAHELAHVLQQGRHPPHKASRSEQTHTSIGTGSGVEKKSLSSRLAPPVGMVMRKEADKKGINLLNYERIAEQIHEAIAGLGTDEEGVYLALQRLGRNPVAISQLKHTYKRKYGESLIDAIYGDFSGTELEYALQLLNEGQKDSAQAIRGVPSGEDEWGQAVKRLREAVQGWGTDEEAIFAVLLPLNRDPALIRSIKDKYKATYNEDLRERIIDEMSGTELDNALYLLGEGPKGMAPKFAADFADKQLGKAMSAAEARKTLEAFGQVSKTERRKLFNLHYASGNMARFLKSVTRRDAIEHHDVMRQLLRWFQEEETRRSSGMTDDEMAKLQARHMEREREERAREKIKSETRKGEKTREPTPSDLKKAHEENVARSSIEQRKEEDIEWNKKSKTEKDKWKNDAAEVVKEVVAYAHKHFPELKLTKHYFKADFEGVEKRGKRVLAYGETDAHGKHIAVFGYRFVEAAQADPAYVMSVVVHEIFGHPEYGPYGSEYLLSIYDKAAAKMKGYKQPAGKKRTAEIDNFAYQGTEIYSLLRSLPYHKSLADKDKGKGLVSIDPRSTVRYRIGLIKKNWHPRIAVALVRGLYQRFSHDPRITPEALEAFKDGVKAKFKKEAAEILK